jgi:hypothetical protein
MIAAAQGASPHANMEVIEDTAPENPDDYPKITYWRKRAHLDEKNRQKEFSKGGRKGHKCKNGKNVAFWHFQHADGTVLEPNEVKEIQHDSKKIWWGMCKRFGPIGALWTTISPTWQLEFHIKIEAKYPILWLCENHYKADTIAFSDYSHWYDKQYPEDPDDDSDSDDNEDDKDKDKDKEEEEEEDEVDADNKPKSKPKSKPKPKPKSKSKSKPKPKPVPVRNRSRKRARTASPVKAWQPAKKARLAVLVQDEEDDDDDEGLDANAGADMQEHEDDGANVPSDVDTNANADPFPSPRITSPIHCSLHRPIIMSLSSSSDGNYDTPPSSVHSPSKLKPKPRWVQPSPDLPTSTTISRGGTEVSAVSFFFLCTHTAYNTFTAAQFNPNPLCAFRTCTRSIP